MKIIALKLKDSVEGGKAVYGERTAGTVLGLSPETEVNYERTVSRMSGTGYKSEVYRICGTDDAIIIHRNDGVGGNIYFDNAELSKGYFAKQKEYARQCSQLSKEYEVPFDVALAIGTNTKAYAKLTAAKFHITEELDKDLCAGINRRKWALKEILGKELYDLLGINAMGQEHSMRLANYVWNRRSC